jgi:Beta-lactamase enzyme family
MRTRARAQASVFTSAVLAGAVAAGVATSVSPAGAAAQPANLASAARSSPTPICTSAKDPALAKKISDGIATALRHRTDKVGLAAADPGDGLTCEVHYGWHFLSASVIKVTIISALLVKEGGPTKLTKLQRSQAWLMITESDDDAATALWNDAGGVPGMQVFLDKAGMKHTELNYAWGLTRITPQDELRLLTLLVHPDNKVLGMKTRAYVLNLMAHVIASQRWGTPAGAPRDVTVHVKNGWLPYPDADDWHINSLGVFTGKDIGYQVVILTGGTQSEEYGIDTIQAAAEVINKDVAG